MISLKLHQMFLKKPTKNKWIKTQIFFFYHISSWSNVYFKNNLDDKLRDQC